MRTHRRRTTGATTHRRRAIGATLTTPLAALVISAVVLTGCASNTDIPSAPDETTTQTEPAIPADPFEKDVLGQRQKDTVAQIVTAGKNRTDVDDTAIVAALVASNAEAHWYRTLPGEVRRDLFGWSNVSYEDDPGSPAHDSLAIDTFYDEAGQIIASENTPLEPVDLAQQVQLHDETKLLSYFADRPAFGDRWSSLSTPEKSKAAYQDSLPDALAAFQLSER